MGAGIFGVIPMTLKRIDNRDEFFNKGFFENYDKFRENNEDIYMIKEEILINNYEDFLYEFYDIIEEEISKDGTFKIFENKFEIPNA